MLKNETVARLLSFDLDTMTYIVQISRQSCLLQGMPRRAKPCRDLANTYRIPRKELRGLRTCRNRKLSLSVAYMTNALVYGAGTLPIATAPKSGFCTIWATSFPAVPAT